MTIGDQTRRANLIIGLEMTADEMVEIEAQLLCIAATRRTKSSTQLEILMAKKNAYDQQIDHVLRSPVMALFQE